MTPATRGVVDEIYVAPNHIYFQCPYPLMEIQENTFTTQQLQDHAVLSFDDWLVFDDPALETYEGNVEAE